MDYLTLEQLIDRYGETTLVGLTDRGDAPTDAVDTDVIDRAIKDANAVIDGYVRTRYAQLSSVPPLLADLALTIAFWKLHRFDPPPKVRTDYEDALSMLKGISRGDVVLDVEGQEPDGNEANGVRITDRERPLTAENLKGFI